MPGVPTEISLIQQSAKPIRAITQQELFFEKRAIYVGGICILVTPKNS